MSNPRREPSRRSRRRAWLSAREASAFLGVKLPTLYAYASRGLVESVPGGPQRTRQYLRADLERLRARREARAGHRAVASAALRFGAPVLDSSITAITREGPRYRGHSALELAASGVPFESVAELLWSGELPTRAPRWRADGLGVPLAQLVRLSPAGSPPAFPLALATAALGLRDPGRFDPSSAAVAGRARPLILRLAACLALGLEPRRAEAAVKAPGVAHAVAIALGARAERPVIDALRAALILMADHELNASAFAARVAASAGADPYGCVSAALAAAFGPRHAGSCDRIEALVRETGAPERAEPVVHARARRGEQVPGFGHPLYPGGDPRARPLLEAATRLAPRAPSVRTTLALVDAMRAADRGEPTVDVGLVALAAALRLPPGAAVAIFVVGRAAGWIAHVLEQYEAGYLLRPRARTPESV